MPLLVRGFCHDQATGQMRAARHYMGDCGVVGIQLTTEKTNCGYAVVALEQYSPESILVNIGLLETLFGQLSLIGRLIEKNSQLYELQMKHFSEQVEPEHKPRLGVAQNSDGSLTMSLETEIGYEYTILYLNPSDNKWAKLKGHEGIKGTGERIEFKQKFSKKKKVPAFTVDYVKIK